VDVEVVLVDQPGDDELGREVCYLLAELGRITLVRGALRARGLYVSDERLRKLLRRYCFDLYRAVRHAPRRRRVAVDSDDECLI